MTTSPIGQKVKQLQSACVFVLVHVDLSGYGSVL